MRMRGICKATAFFIVAIFLISIILVSCLYCTIYSENWNPQGDWHYELDENYCINRINSTTITLSVKEGNHFSSVVDKYITCFCYNECFVAVRRLFLGDRDSFEDIMQMDFDQAQYYLVDLKNGNIFGPFEDERDFIDACKVQNVGVLGGWIDTYPTPRGAKY